MDDRKSVEVTQEMILAAVEILSDWKCETDYLSECQAVEEMYRAMAAIQAIQSSQKQQDQERC
jgi:hypothetical protein